MAEENKSWFKKLIEQYNQLCKDLGVDNGACRSCVLVVKFDPEQDEQKAEKPEQKS